MAKAMKGLPDEFINELMATSRSRNVYGPKLLDFCESDEAAINPAEVWPIEFGNKKATTLYQGFRNAAEKADLQEVVMIKQSDDAVFILHKERVSVLMAANADQSENGNGEDADTEAEDGNGADTDTEAENGTEG